MIIEQKYLKKAIELKRKISKNLEEGFGNDPIIIGLVSGGFDIIHHGHTDFLKEAKALCNILIVLLDSDESIKNKDERFIMDRFERLSVISAIKYVDYATWHDEIDIMKIIKLLKPDLYIRSGDLIDKDVVPAQTVLNYGGDVVTIPIRFDISTAQIINRIKGLPYGK